MAKAYYAQDVKALLDLMNEKFNTTCDYTPEEMAQLLDNRNLDWASRMPAIMKAAPTLFVVGAGHLPGSKGVLKLLQEKDTRLRLLSLNCIQRLLFRALR